MTLTYEINDSLYINLTNQCYNNCVFCIRRKGDGAYGSDSLWLEQEPSKEDVFEAIKKRDLNQYKAVVFCGFGEPMARLYDLLWICKKIREISDVTIRIDTNGTADLIYGEPVAHLLKGLVDVISISINTSNSVKYDELCKPNWGEKTYFGIMQFIRDCKRYVPRVIITVVDCIGQEEIEKCRQIAEDLNVEYRVRHEV